MAEVELYYFLNYVLAVLLLIFLAVALAFFFSPARADRDKSAPYECGFHPFEDARKEFNIHFYLVALLFVAFDLEVLILLPWALDVVTFDVPVYWVVNIFLGLIFLGFLYEWRHGVLSW